MKTSQTILITENPLDMTKSIPGEILEQLETNSDEKGFGDLQVTGNKFLTFEGDREKSLFGGKVRFRKNQTPSGVDRFSDGSRLTDYVQNFVDKFGVRQFPRNSADSQNRSPSLDPKEKIDAEFPTRLNTTLETGVDRSQEFSKSNWNKYLEYRDSQDAQCLIRVHRSRKNTPSMENPEKSYIFPCKDYQTLKNGQI